MVNYSHEGLRSITATKGYGQLIKATQGYGQLITATKGYGQLIKATQGALAEYWSWFRIMV